MSNYRLVVTRVEPNPQYDPKYHAYSSGMIEPRQVLDVILTDAEYGAVKKAAIEASK